MSKTYEERVQAAREAFYDRVVLSNVPIQNKSMKINVIKLTKLSAVKIDELLADINGKAEAHTFANHASVTTAAKRGCRHMLRYMSKKDSKGARFRAYSSGPVSKSYKHQRIGNELTFEIGANGNAFLIKVEKITFWRHSDGGDCRFDFTLAQKDAIMTKAIADASRIIS
jgi:hypothetical protein